jgi:hypothetical protein
MSAPNLLIIINKIREMGQGNISRLRDDLIIMKVVRDKFEQAKMLHDDDDDDADDLRREGLKSLLEHFSIGPDVIDSSVEGDKGITEDELANSLSSCINEKHIELVNAIHDASIAKSREAIAVMNGDNVKLFFREFNRLHSIGQDTEATARFFQTQLNKEQFGAIRPEDWDSSSYYEILHAMQDRLFQLHAEEVAHGQDFKQLELIISIASNPQGVYESSQNPEHTASTFFRRYFDVDGVVLEDPSVFEDLCSALIIAAQKKLDELKEEDMAVLRQFIERLDPNSVDDLAKLKSLAMVRADDEMKAYLTSFVNESFEPSLLKHEDLIELHQNACGVLSRCAVNLIKDELKTKTIKELSIIGSDSRAIFPTFAKFIQDFYLDDNGFRSVQDEADSIFLDKCAELKSKILSELKTMHIDELHAIAKAHHNADSVKSALKTKYPEVDFLVKKDLMGILDEAQNNITSRVIDPIVKLINDVKYSAELEELFFDDPDVDDPDADDIDPINNDYKKLDKALVKWLKDKKFPLAIEEGFFNHDQLNLLSEQAFKQKRVLHAPYDNKPANIMLSSKGLWKDFTYEVQRGKSVFSRATALAASTSAQTSAGQESSADAEYLGYHLKGDDAVVFTAKFKVSSGRGATTEVDAKLVLNSAAKVTNMTSDQDYANLSKFDKIRLALKQVEMLLLNYDSENGPVIITGKNPEQAQFILAALYHVKASHEDFKEMKMECYVPGVQVPESSFIKFRTKDKAEAKYVEDTFGANRGLLDGLLSHIGRYNTEIEITSNSATNRTFQRATGPGPDNRKDILDDEVYSPNEDEEDDDNLSLGSEETSGSGVGSAASYGSAATSRSTADSDASVDDDLDDDNSTLGSPRAGR